MPDGDFQTLLPQHGIKGGEPLRLLFSPGKVGTVGGGKMAEQSFCHQSGHGSNLDAEIGVGFRYLETNAAHAGVHGKVEPGGQIHKTGCPAQSFRVLKPVNGGTDALPDGGGESVRRGVPQNQNGGGQPCLPQLHGFQNGADAEESTFLLQKSGNLHGAVSVSVGFDHSHNGNPRSFADGIHVF